MSDEQEKATDPAVPLRKLVPFRSKPQTPEPPKSIIPLAALVIVTISFAVVFVVTALLTSM